MIYLSGKLKERDVGHRPDIGFMKTYHPTPWDFSRERKAELLLRGPWAIDNGCYTQPDFFTLEGYVEWMKLHAAGRPTCLFATAPDVVGDALATWERSRQVLPVIRALGYPAALVAQDGIEGLTVEWDAFDCLFIGGTTEWKLSEAAFRMVAEAKARGKWAHMGRVNSRRRLRVAAQSGCDSADGTGLCFAPDRRLRQLHKWLDEMKRQPFLRSAA